MNLLLEYRKNVKSGETPLKVIDIGCGSGRIGRKLQDSGCQVTGLDFADEAVKKAIANGVNAKRANLDEGIPEEDNSYDVVELTPKSIRMRKRLLTEIERKRAQRGL